MKKSAALWITWENQRRNSGICNALGWTMYCIVHDDKKRVIRYIKSVYETISAIVLEKPRIVAAQNPSIVLCILILLIKLIYRYKVIIDAHNAGIHPPGIEFYPILLISKLIQKYADLTLVTNFALKEIVKSNSGLCEVLPDKIPDVPAVKRVSLDGKENVVFICTYSDDEPYFEVIKAASSLSDDIVVHFTGNYQGKLDVKTLPSNVRLHGFLPEQDYWNLLYSSDYIMDLTTRNDCLVCGAYEGVALSKPLILSDTLATRYLFNKGCAYVLPTAGSIKNGIEYAMDNKSGMQNKVKHLKFQMMEEFNRKINSLKKNIDNL